MNILLISNIFTVIIIVCFSFTYGGAQALEINNEGQLIQKYDDDSFKFVDIHEIQKDFLKTINTKIVQNYFLPRAGGFVEYINESKKMLEIQMLYNKSELDDLYLNIDDIDDEDIEKHEQEIKTLKKKKKENNKLLNKIKDYEDDAIANFNLIKGLKLKNEKKMASSIRKYLKNEISEEEWRIINRTKYSYTEILKDGFKANKKVAENKITSEEQLGSKIEASNAENPNEPIDTKKVTLNSKDELDKEIVISNENNIIRTKEEIESLPITNIKPTYSSTIIPKDRQYAKLSKANNLISNPPKYNCPVIFDDVDELTGKKRKDLATEIIFTYTPDNLKRIMKHDHYMICSGHMSKLTGGYRFLFIEVKIKSRNAKIEYGTLEKGNLLNLKLLNGKNYKIRSGVTNNGVFNKKTGYTTYKTQYKLTSDLYSKLKESPLDKIRIVWSTGYEDYEVYSIDFLINQLNCL